MTPLPRGRTRGYRAGRGVRLLTGEGMRSNPKRLTMIVEGQGMGFWTRVRLPSGPLQHERSNTVQIRSIAVLKNEFGIMLDTSGYDAKKTNAVLRK